MRRATEARMISRGCCCCFSFGGVDEVVATADRVEVRDMSGGAWSRRVLESVERERVSVTPEFFGAVDRSRSSVFFLKTFDNFFVFFDHEKDFEDVRHVFFCDTYEKKKKSEIESVPSLSDFKKRRSICKPDARWLGYR